MNTFIKQRNDISVPDASASVIHAAVIAAQAGKRVAVMGHSHQSPRHSLRVAETYAAMNDPYANDFISWFGNSSERIEFRCGGVVYFLYRKDQLRGRKIDLILYSPTNG